MFKQNCLDLGCIQDTHLILGPNWLHSKIYFKAKTLIGVDIKKKPENLIGYNILQHNIEHLSDTPLTKVEFDTIVAGDIIEHLFNPGLFLDGLKSMMFKELVISTPNVMSPKYWTLGKEQCRDDHTCWYSMKTLTQLLEMKGYIVVDKTYGFDQTINGIRPLIKYLLYKLLPQTGNRLLITATT